MQHLLGPMMMIASGGLFLYTLILAYRHVNESNRKSLWYAIVSTYFLVLLDVSYAFI